MAFEIWGGYLAYGIGYALTAAFLIGYRKDVFGRAESRVPKHDYKHAAAA